MDPLNPNIETSRKHYVGNSGNTIISDLVNGIVIILLCCFCIASYHYFYVEKQLKEAGAIYYTVDLEAIVKAKIQAATSGINMQQSPEAFEKLTEKMRKDAEHFEQSLSSDLEQLSKGRPIFQKGAIVKNGAGVVDLTDVLRKKYNL